MKKEKVVLITGCTKGIGFSIAKLLLEKKFYVIGCARSNKTELGEEFKSLLQQYMNLTYLQCDATNDEDVRNVFLYIQQKYGYIDALVNNVGGSEKHSLISMSIDKFKSTIEKNLFSAVLCTKYAVKSMILQRQGKIINIASTAGTNGMPFESLYSAAKAGMIGFTKAIAKEYGPKGILCNAIAPGIINTDNSKETPEEVIKTIPVRRVGLSQDIAEVVGFLLDNKINYITGQIIKVDGGLFS